MGRPTKLNDELQEKICEGVRLGLTPERAAVLAGIHRDTFYDWKAKGEKAKTGRFFDFSDAVKKAQIRFEEDNLEIIRKAARGRTWQAAAWLLERRMPERYSRPDATSRESAPDRSIAENRNDVRGRLLSTLEQPDSDGSD